jgi:hypothetical protein
MTERKAVTEHVYNDPDDRFRYKDIEGYSPGSHIVSEHVGDGRYITVGVEIKELRHNHRVIEINDLGWSFNPNGDLMEGTET